MTYEEFESKILKLTGVDLLLYKEKQMKRRINTLIERLKMGDYAHYLEHLHNDKLSLGYFLDYITINVTEFFRTQDQWDFMVNTVIPDLPDNAVIWSSACSSGEEAYSLAISIAKCRPLNDIRIIATDIDDNMLRTAMKGEYQKRTMNNVSDEDVNRFFAKTEKGYSVVDEIRSHVEFRKLNLLSDEFPKDCNMIVCRNVLIYLTDEAKYMLYRKFHDCLSAEGYLFTGHAEQILRYREFGFEKIKKFLYKRSETPK